MTAVKRMEIVVDSVELPRITAAIDAAGVSGYTILRGVEGKGDRGLRSGDQPADVLKNVMLIVAATPAQAETLAKKIHPMLKRFGGMCLVSDASWVDH